MINRISGKHKILFRADANQSIGTGDLISLVHLSKYFEKDGWETHFIIRDYNPGITIAKKHKLKNLSIINCLISIKQEVDKINDYINSNGIDIIFFEITERSLKEYSKVTNRAKKVSVCFDGTIPNDMDLVVNWDVNANNLFDTNRYPNTKFLLGLQYAILPLNFDFEKIAARTFLQKPETLLIAMGGADDLNFTQKVIDVLLQNRISLKIIIIVGSGYRYKDELEASLKNSSIQYEIKQNVTNMFEEYMRCDIALGAGGLTSFELIATRTPAIIIATYEHQIARSVYFDHEEMVKYLGFRQFDSRELIENINTQIKPNKSLMFMPYKILECVNELF